MDPLVLSKMSKALNGINYCMQYQIASNLQFQKFRLPHKEMYIQLEKKPLPFYAEKAITGTKCNCSVLFFEGIFAVIVCPCRSLSQRRHGS